MTGPRVVTVTYPLTLPIEIWRCVRHEQHVLDRSASAVIRDRLRQSFVEHPTPEPQPCADS